MIYTPSSKHRICKVKIHAIQSDLPQIINMYWSVCAAYFEFRVACQVSKHQSRF